MLPRVAVFAMGGTIAMAERGEHGVKPSLDADALVDAVPQLADVASIEAETFRLLPSPEVTIPDLFALADAIEQAVTDGAHGGGHHPWHRHDGGDGLRARPHPRARCPRGGDRRHAQPDARRARRAGQPAQRRAPRGPRAGAGPRRHGRHERRDPRRALRAEGEGLEPGGLPLGHLSGRSAGSRKGTVRLTGSPGPPATLSPWARDARARCRSRCSR